MKTALLAAALCCAIAATPVVQAANPPRILPPGVPITNPTPTPGTYCGAVPVCLIPLKK